MRRHGVCVKTEGLVNNCDLLELGFVKSENGFTKNEKVFS